MAVAAIIALALIVVGALLYLHHRLTGGDQPSSASDAHDVVADEGCCGMHITCEKDSLVTGLDDKVEYYDDEELDVYAGKRSEEYSHDEIEQFRDVLLTLRPDDIAGWARSIAMRGIVLPSDVRDELLMIVAEARNNKDRQ